MDLTDTTESKLIRMNLLLMSATRRGLQWYASLE